MRNFIYILLFLPILLFGQTTFDKLYSHTDDIVLGDVVQFENNTYLVSYCKKIHVDTIAAGLMHLDSLGNLIKDSVFTNNEQYHLAKRIISGKTKSTAIFIIRYITDSVIYDSLLFVTVNQDFNLLNTTKIGVFEDTAMIEEYFLSSDNQDNILISGYLIPPDSNYLYPDLIYPFIIKLDSNFNEKARYSEPSNQFWVAICQGVESQNDSFYYFSADGLSQNNSSNSQIIRFDKDLNYVSTKELSSHMLSFNSSPTYYKKDELLIIGYENKDYTGYDDFSILVLDSSLSEKWYHSYDAIDSCIRPCMDSPISRSGKYFYLGGVIYKDIYGNDTSNEILLVKMDTNYQVVWKRTIESIQYNKVVKVNATLDGGCLIGSWCVDHSNWKITGFRLTKVDSLGQVMWTNDINMPQLPIKVYPNPATTHITIDWQQPNAEFLELKIYSSTGELVQRFDNVKAGQELSVEQFSSGVYLIEGLTAKGQRFIGKFVKE
jgi:hypothetical protein